MIFQNLKPSKLLLCLLLTGISLSGCSGITQYVSVEHPKMIDEIPFRADYPIAREIRYFLYDNIVMNDKRGRPLIATNEVDIKGGKPGTFTPIDIPSASPGTNWSDIYARKTTDARSAGRHDKVRFYSSLSQSHLEVEMAMNNMVNNVSTMFSIYSGTMQILGIVAQAWLESTAAELAKWTAETTRCVGDSAPEGSILHLEIFKVLYGKKWNLDSRIDFIVTATLEDGKGAVIKSVRNLGLLTYGKGKDNADAGEGFVLLNRETYSTDRLSMMESLKNHAWGIQYAVLINSAIADLYARIEEFKGTAGGSN
jgi:hypothetical protein